MYGTPLLRSGAPAPAGGQVRAMREPAEVAAANNGICLGGKRGSPRLDSPALFMANSVQAERDSPVLAVRCRQAISRLLEYVLLCDSTEIPGEKIVSELHDFRNPMP